MRSFLEHVAADLLKKNGTDLARTAVVFPNKRASLFLNEYLAQQAGHPLWSPAYITISDLFRNHSELTVADPIKLVCELHKCFVACTGIQETLDHFYGWGQLLLTDFDDIDKNMAPAERVFANLRDIHELDDSSYLTDEQKTMIRQFFSNFSEDHQSELKKRFLQLWSHIGDIYTLFNKRLEEQGLAYEGALYRKVALDETLDFEYDNYIFIGFNLLQQVEQTLFIRLQQRGKARFYWDFDTAYIGKDEAGHYISQYLELFPNELNTKEEAVYDNLNKPKHVSYISAPTENIQARYVSTWLSENNRLQGGRSTAIVLANEGLLQTVIHCLPNETEKVNITTGYPLAQTPVASLVTLLTNLQTNGYAQKSKSFRLRYVNLVLRHPYARYISPLYAELLKTINSKKIYFPDQKILAKDEALGRFFTPITEQDTTAFHLTLISWLLAQIQHIAKNCQAMLTEIGREAPLDTESLFRMYTLLNRLKDLIMSGDLIVDTPTLQRLIGQLINTTSIPFHGEPAEGIQIMGILETRNIDFKHVLLLSCNEGCIPKGVNDTSFIPYSIRKAYGLITVDNKVAIYAYYFHRLLQRAENVTLVYNNSTNDGQTGEMSRFMLQMMVEGKQKIKFQTLQAGQKPAIRKPAPIQKTPALMAILKERLKLLTPSAINRYMRCQLRFFYYYGCELEELEDSEEEMIDNRIFGNIFHLAAQNLYKQLKSQSPQITKATLERLLKEEVDIIQAIDNAIKEELFQIKDPTRKMPPLDGLQLINREVLIKYLRLLLEIDIRLTPFTILELEGLVTMRYTTSDGIHVVIGGTIDRLDKITTPEGQEKIRVIDYKTGSKRIKSLADVDAVFLQESLKDHSDYFLQTFLYSHIVRTKSNNVPVSPALLFIQHAGTEDYDPTLCLAKKPVEDIATISEPFMQHIDSIISDIFNPDLALIPTEDRQRCQHCPYVGLCGITK